MSKFLAILAVWISVSPALPEPIPALPGSSTRSIRFMRPRGRPSRDTSHSQRRLSSVNK
jgi:hypothetical protein